MPPENSAWSADPDPCDPDLYSPDLDPDDTVSSPDGQPLVTPPDVSPSPSTPPITNDPFTATVALFEASSSDNDSDWLGDDDYDEDGTPIPPKRGLPSRLLRPQGNRRLARAYERRRKVVELRLEGYSFPEIAKELKFNSVDGARDAFKRAMLDVRDVAEEYRDLELLRLESMTQVLWPMVQAGDLEAIDKYLKVAGLRVKITRMDQMALMSHSQTDEERDMVERVGMVEDVQTFLAMLPNLVQMTNQPAPLVINPDGSFVHEKDRED